MEEGNGISPGDAKITLSLTNIPLSEAIRYVTSLAGLKVRIDPYSVTIVPLSEPTDSLVTREYVVPPGFLSMSGSAGGGGPPSLPEITGIPKRTTAFDYLQNAGVQSPPGATANYLPASGKLIVRNTQANLDLVDQIVEQAYANTSARTPSAPEERKAAGILPMKLELQHAGREFSFHGYYAAESVSFHYVDWWGQARRGWVWGIAGGIAFFAMAGLGAWRRLVWGALVMTFIPICIAQSLTGMCNALLAGWLMGFVIHQIATRLVFRRRALEVAAV